MTSMYGAKRKDGTKKRYYVCGLYHNNGRSMCNPNLIPADFLEKEVFKRISGVLSSNIIMNELTQRIND